MNLERRLEVKRKRGERKRKLRNKVLKKRWKNSTLGIIELASFYTAVFTTKPLIENCDTFVEYGLLFAGITAGAYFFADGFSRLVVNLPVYKARKEYNDSLKKEEA
jgi:hypothetical protein